MFSAPLRFVAMASACLSLTILTGCGTEQEAPTEGDVTSLKIATPSPSILPWIAYYIAGPLGFYEAEGLEVEIVGSVPGGDSAQAIATGTIDMGGVSVSQGLPLLAASDDNSLRWAGFDQLWPFHVSVLPDSDIDDYSDLRGKNIAIREARDEELVGAMLAAEGLNPGDYTLTRLGEGGTLTAGLVEGRVDAMFGSVFNEAFVETQTGDKVRQLPNDYNEFVNSGLMSRSEDSETLGRLARAVAKAWIWASENPESAVDLLAEDQPGAASDRDEAISFLEPVMELVDPMLERQWEASPELLATELELLAPNSNVDPGELVDQEALETAWSFDVEALRTAAADGDVTAAADVND